MIYASLFFTFLQIGAFSFGGGYAMIPLIQEKVLLHGWLDPEQLINFIAVSESTPGPFAVNIATYIGMQTAGLLGASCATFGIVLPSFLVILLVARTYLAFQKNEIVRGCMSGLKPAVVGLIAAAALSISGTVFFPAGFALSVFSTPVFYFSLFVFAASVFMALRKVHPILIIILSAICAVAAGYGGLFG